MLLIDSGNSAIKCRYIKNKIPQDSVFSTYKQHAIDEFSRYLQTIKTDRVYLASVSAEAINTKILTAVFQNLQVHATSLKSLAELNGFKNGYDNHQQLGVDRWLTSLAARQQVDGDCILIDAGTAIKIELLSASQGFLGGAILPGFQTGQQRFKEIFPSIDFNANAFDIMNKPGKNTHDCLYLPADPVGIEHIKRILAQWKKHIQSPFKIILTGQDAGQISHQLEMEHCVIPDLLFQGMLKQIDLLG